MSRVGIGVSLGPGVWVMKRVAVTTIVKAVAPGLMNGVGEPDNGFTVGAGVSVMRTTIRLQASAGSKIKVSNNTLRYLRKSLTPRLVGICPAEKLYFSER